jgi:hypothetical protein
VKENLKPYAYKQSELSTVPREPCEVTACLLHNEPASYRMERG